MIANLGSAEQAPLSGLTVADIASKWQMEPVDTVFKLLLDNGGAVGAVYFSISGDDVAAIVSSPSSCGLRRPWTQCHKRQPTIYSSPFLWYFSPSWGTLSGNRGYCPRNRYLQMTGLPATRLGLKDRGFIKPGMFADLTIFDPAQVADKS